MLAVLFDGCPKSGSSTQPLAATDILARSYCRMTERCGRSTSAGLSNYAECVDRYLAYYEALFALPGAGMTIETASACATVRERARCGHLAEDIGDQCWIRGSLGAGSECVAGEQCASGQCSLYETCPGACSASVGESCGHETDAGFVDCVTMRCIDGVCHDYAKLGETCSGSWDCIAGLACIESTCSQRSWEGGTCSWDSDCEDSLACIQSTCSRLRREGESCDWSHLCEETLYCSDEEGVCRAPTFLGPGEDCYWSDAVCAPGLECFRYYGCQPPQWSDDGEGCGNRYSPFPCKAPATCVEFEITPDYSPAGGPGGLCLLGPDQFLCNISH